MLVKGNGPLPKSYIDAGRHSLIQRNVEKYCRVTVILHLILKCTFC